MSTWYLSSWQGLVVITWCYMPWLYWADGPFGRRWTWQKISLEQNWFNNVMALAFLMQNIVTVLSNVKKRITTIKINFRINLELICHYWLLILLTGFTTNVFPSFYPLIYFQVIIIVLTQSNSKYSNVFIIFLQAV